MHPGKHPLARGASLRYSGRGIETRSVYLVVADADAAYARAVAAGAVVIRPRADTPYGSRDFTVKDPEGHTWGAGTYDPWAKQE